MARKSFNVPRPERFETYQRTKVRGQDWGGIVRRLKRRGCLPEEGCIIDRKELRLINWRRF